MPAFRNQKNSENSFSFSAFCQFNDVILYTSRGMMPTNQFKVHGQLPLHGMTVSALSPPLQVLLAAVPSLSLPAELSFSSPQPRFQRLLVLLPISGGALPQIHPLSRGVFFFFGRVFFVCFLFFCVGPFSCCRSERARMSGVYRTPSRWWASSSRWWWRPGKNGRRGACLILLRC